MRRTAAAPSLIWEALPAWMEPSLAKAGLMVERDSGVMPGRMPSSLSTRGRVLTVSVLGSSHLTFSSGAISSLNLPDCWAARAF